MQRILFVFLLFVSMTTEVYGKPLHFVLISASEKENVFWKSVDDFSRQAAKQLQVKLSILYANTSKQQLLQQLTVAKSLNADAVILPNIKQGGVHIMEKAEQLEIPVFIFNSGFLQKNKSRIGQPRQSFRYWLGSLLPDDKQAGYLLGKNLIEQARLLNLSDEKGRVEIIAINGSIADTPATLRLEGLKDAIKEDGNSHLVRCVHAYWLQETAKFKSKHLIQRHPNVKVYWAASDLMAIGVNNALSEKGMIQGDDYVTGGVDWSKEGLSAIKQGHINSSVGGHFMEAAWAVILLYDYFHGINISEMGSYQLRSPMSLISSKEIELLLPHLGSGDWSDIDFRTRSKSLNREITRYDFSPISILEELKANNAHIKKIL